VVFVPRSFYEIIVDKTLFVMKLIKPNSLIQDLGLRLPDVLERQELSLNLLSKRVMSMILEKHFVVQYLSIFRRL